MTTLGFAIHPGAILREEFMLPYELKPYTLAKKLGVSRSPVERLVREETPVSPDMALRLAAVFGTSAEFWMNMQSAYDLFHKNAAMKDDLAKLERFAA